MGISHFAHRLARARANCYESFPVIAGLLLLALATGQSEVADSLALWVLAARVAQSSTHLISTSNLAVNIRFSLVIRQQEFGITPFSVLGGLLRVQDPLMIEYGLVGRLQ